MTDSTTNLDADTLIERQFYGRLLLELRAGLDLTDNQLETIIFDYFRHSKGNIAEGDYTPSGYSVIPPDFIGTPEKIFRTDPSLPDRIDPIDVINYLAESGRKFSSEQVVSFVTRAHQWSALESRNGHPIAVTEDIRDLEQFWNTIISKGHKVSPDEIIALTRIVGGWELVQGTFDEREQSADALAALRGDNGDNLAACLHALHLDFDVAEPFARLVKDGTIYELKYVIDRGIIPDVDEFIEIQKKLDVVESLVPGVPALSDSITAAIDLKLSDFDYLIGERKREGIGRHAAKAIDGLLNRYVADGQTLNDEQVQSLLEVSDSEWATNLLSVHLANKHSKGGLSVDNVLQSNVPDQAKAQFLGTLAERFSKGVQIDR